MSKKTLAVLALAGTMLLASVPMFAQAAQPQSVPGAGAQPTTVTDQDVQMLRADIRAKRKDVTAQNMTLTPDEATKFWPLYDQYMAEVTKVGDTRWALIQDYAKNYNTMTDAQAQDFIKKSGAVEQQFTAASPEVRADLREGHLAEEGRSLVSDRSPLGPADQPAVGGFDPSGRHHQVISLQDVGQSSASQGALLLLLRRQRSSVNDDSQDMLYSLSRHILYSFG